MTELRKKLQAVKVNDGKKFNPDRNKLNDNLRTHCSLCRRGVFVGQEYVWSKLGIVHLGCFNENEQEAL